MSERDIGIDASDFRQAADALEKAGFERQAGRTVAWAIRRSTNVVRRHVDFMRIAGMTCCTAR